jgi:hypothetical protein
MFTVTMFEVRCEATGAGVNHTDEDDIGENSSVG